MYVMGRNALFFNKFYLKDYCFSIELVSCVFQNSADGLFVNWLVFSFGKIPALGREIRMGRCFSVPCRRASSRDCWLS